MITLVSGNRVDSIMLRFRTDWLEGHVRHKVDGCGGGHRVRECESVALPRATVPKEPILCSSLPIVVFYLAFVPGRRFQQRCALRTVEEGTPLWIDIIHMHLTLMPFSPAQFFLPWRSNPSPRYLHERLRKPYWHSNMSCKLTNRRTQAPNK